MDLSGWPIDLPALYGHLWPSRSRFHLAERVFEAPDGRWAVVLFGLGEIGMNKQVGPLAVFRDKASPALVYHSGKTPFWYEGLPGEPVVFTSEGKRAKVFEFVRGRSGEFGSRERTIDIAWGCLLSLPGIPDPPPEK